MTPQRFTAWMIAAGWTALLGSTLVLLGCGTSTTPSASSPATASAGSAALAGPRPRQSPFLNVQPEVRYVGDQACVGCHISHGQTFAHHPMAQSLAPMDRAAAKEKYNAEARNPFKVGNVEYRVERRGEQLIHSESLVNGDGRVVCAAETEVKYAVGSGVSGRSYLIERDGTLRMSSITWYPRKQLWDLSPGYAVRHHHFNRPIMAECLFCHCNHAAKKSDLLNTFEKPIFQGHTIGCERCHGPGELHVKARQPNTKIEGTDFTIVNPRRLEPELREAVCQQCHLQGQHRILRRGTDTFDYRPGLPLQDFLTVFVRHPELVAGNKFVGQVDQMYASKCFQQSRGKMGCTSCHDPHVFPTPEQRVAYYRQRCLTCHQEADCSLPLPERKQKSSEDSCIQCHMPANEANITHTSFSDHRVPRRPEAEPASPAGKLRPGMMPLVPFHATRDAHGAAELDRDLGIALMMMAETHPASLQHELARQALPRLERANPAQALDFPAWEAQANALWHLGQREEATEVFAALLARAPRLETALSSAASLATEMRRHRSAVRYWERACALNPHRVHYRHGLATVHAATGDWNSALYECRQGLHLHPLSPELRQLAVVSQLALGDAKGAKADFEILMVLDPREAEGVRARFPDQLGTP